MSGSWLKNYEIITPTRTEVTAGEFRMPEPGEVLVTHDVSMDNILQGRIGSLAIQNRSPRFAGSFTQWHYDYIHTQAHFTEAGRLRVWLAGIRGELPSRDVVRQIRSELTEAAEPFLIAPGDLLAFGGSRSEIPILHSLRAVEEPRSSYFLAIQIK